MPEYLSWDKITITDFSDENIDSHYQRGYVFTRVGKGVMVQTRSVRVNLAEFETSSENRRILRKVEDLTISWEPIPYEHYSWEIGKMVKDFYAEKFGEGTFSANKAREIFTDAQKSNFNLLLRYARIEQPTHCITYGENPPIRMPSPKTNDELHTKIVDGYAIGYETGTLLHYSYPFYNLSTEIQNMGMGMMLLAIISAKHWGKKYMYLGSAQRPGDIYKLQFKGLEWFDGETWNTGTDELKNILK